MRFEDVQHIIISNADTFKMEESNKVPGDIVVENNYCNFVLKIFSHVLIIFFVFLN